MDYNFFPDLTKVADFNGLATIDEFNEENSIFSSSPEFAKTTGGKLSERILNAWDWNDEYLKHVDNKTKYLVIDTRVQRLMPGMYPSIPGWHCDGVPRDDYYAQPDFDLIDPSVRHYLALIATDKHVSNTEFLSEPIKASLDYEKGAMYKQLHQQVEAKSNTRMTINVGEIWRFNQAAIHRTLPTATRGWRMFFRMSIYHKPPLNMQSNQQQVYLLSEENGW